MHTAPPYDKMRLFVIHLQIPKLQVLTFLVNTVRI